jgi:hypothetical protein
MPELLWPVTNSAKRKIEKSVEDHQELYWYRRHKSQLELRAVTVTYETGKFRSKSLWIFDDFNDEDINDARRLEKAVASLYPERYKNLAPSGIDKILSDMFFDGVISKTEVM